MNRNLRDAASIVNATKRRDYDPPLIIVAICRRCTEDFAMLSQLYSRAKLNDGPIHCRECAIKHRREKRRKAIS